MSAPIRPEWEPEPLRLPVEPPVRRAPPADADHDPPRSSERDRAGSHVIVIDIA